MNTTPNAVPGLENLSHGELLVRRQELLAKGKNPSEMSDSDLTELVGILNLLRRRTSGPPKAATKKTSTAGMALEDLL